MRWSLRGVAISLGVAASHGELSLLQFCGLFGRKGIRGASSSLAELISRVPFRIEKWALVRKEFSNFNLDDSLFNWEVCMGCGSSKVRSSIHWSPPPFGVLKFNMGGASRGKPGPASVGGKLCNCKGEVLIMFSKHCRSLWF